MNVSFGVMIDAAAGMPAYWTLGEGPPIIAFGTIIWWLNRMIGPSVVRRL